MKHAFGKTIKKVIDPVEDDEKDTAGVAEGEIDEKKVVTKSKNPDDPYIPRVPTIGWMLSELERCGVPMRGHPGIMKKGSVLVRLLRERGYDVHNSEGDAKRVDGDR